MCSARIDDEVLCSPGLVKVLIKHYSTALPLIDWLCGALDLDV